jgi:hypothetical protein
MGVVILYLSVAALFTWPLPLHLSESFLGPPGSDLGVYVWNLWVFRHELVAHPSFPFFTNEILSLSPSLPLTLQNYTTFANLLAFPALPFTGIVATLNLLTLVNLVLAGYAMFVYALRRMQDAAAAVIAGLLFGFSPFMTARAAEHFSLIQAAPLPVFGLLMLRLAQQPTLRLSILAGVVVAWAFLCDPYYAVYCLYILAFMVAYSVVNIDFRPEPLRREWWTTLLDIAILSVLGLVIGILVSGGGRVQVLGVRISMFRLYTPVLVLTVLVGIRAWILLHPHLRLVLPAWRPSAMVAAPAAVALIVVLAPVLVPMFAAAADGFPGPGPVLWRSSSPGLDAAAYFMPNPFNPWIGSWCAAWYQARSNGFAENVVSVPWVALGVMAAATLVARRWAHAGWVAFTAAFALMSLGPFIVVGGMMTHIPGPWALLRYLPVLGAARMPTRLSILVFLGLSMLVAMAVHALRRQVPWPKTITAAIGLMLVVEMAPGQRTMYSAAIPAIHRTIKADPRLVRVTNLPFGLRDGLSSVGNTSAVYQYHQTAHEKPLVGGYVSRLPRGAADRYKRFPVTSALIDLSEGRSLTPERRASVLEAAHNRPFRLRIGWVVVDTRSASPELEQFAIEAFDLTYVERDGPWKLYRRELPPP